MQAPYTRDLCLVDLEMLLLGLQHFCYDNFSCSEDDEQDRERWRRASDFLRAHSAELSKGSARLKADLEQFAGLRFPTEAHTQQIEVVLTLLQNWRGSDFDEAVEWLKA